MSENNTKTGRSCNFPASALRAYYSQILSGVKALEACDPNADVRSQMTVLLSVERLRLDHEDVVGCRCWYTPAELSRINALGTAQCRS
jgi:hypothetical protein